MATPSAGSSGGGPLFLENACLDLFLLELDAPSEQLRALLAAAWEQDALTALRLVCARRGVPRDPISWWCQLLGLLRRNVVVPLLTALEKQPSSSSQQQQQQQQAATTKTKLPHQIAAHFGKEIWAKKSNQSTRDKITEEWLAMVAGLRARGCLRNCVAVCDTTTGGLKVGTNDRTRLQVCVALGLLIPELSDRPWSNWVHSFSATTASIPIGSIDAYTDKVAAIRGMKSEDRFDLCRVFQWVLLVAEEEKVPPAGMVRNIIVLTGRDLEHAAVAPTKIGRPEDMEHPENYDPRHVRRWRDEYRILKGIFSDHGYAEHVPGVVFWNLRGEPRSAASTRAKDGILVLNGYSNELMSLFLDKSGVVEPDDEMFAAIAGDEYQKLINIVD